MSVDRNVVNYKKESWNVTRFAQIEMDPKCRYKLELHLKENKPINLVIRTDERNLEKIDVIEKVEFDANIR